ncbi:MAG: ion transporter [Spirochaetia bacterium]|nr:ion transporter [Spirochaetia bacterium]
MRKFLSDLFENNNSKRKIFFDIFINILILISVYTIIQEYIYENENELFIIANDVFFYIFVLEYFIRLWLCTTFIKDYKDEGLSYAIINKIKWILKPNSIIDLLAILPDIRYLRLFRIFRLIRILRIVRLFRSVHVQSAVERGFLILRSFRETTMLFFLLFFFVFSALIIISLFIYASETKINKEFSTFLDSILYSFQLVDIVDDLPKTGWGKLGSSLLLLVNMVFFGIFISLITTNVEEVLDRMKKGKLGKVNYKNHIILCGFTKSTEAVIKELLCNKKKKPKIILISRKQNPDITGVIYMNGDFSKMETLKKANISQAAMVVVFTEKLDDETYEVVDMRTMLTIFNVEKEVPEVHTVAEIIETENGDIIREKIKGDELIFKETLDGNLIASCVKHPYISSMIYDLLDTKGNSIKEYKAIELLNAKIKTVKDIKMYAIENNITFLGFIDEYKKSNINPDNNLIFSGNERLIFIC